ncbi:MAG: Mov34/MPN/PAD-1 family protein [Candidatus Micrarchaeota archaeon]
MLEIKKNALLSALQGAKETHPNEFVCLLRGEKTSNDWLLTEVIITPFANYDKTSSSYSSYFIPANNNEAASFHSHPMPNSSRPSKQDLNFFSRTARFHFIASYPYEINDVKAFDSTGKEIEFQVV